MLRLAAVAGLLVVVAACSTTPAAEVAPAPSAQGSASAAASNAPAGGPSASAAGDAALPTKAECDAFMDVIARTTGLRASIQRDPSDATRAADWAARSAELAEQTKKMNVTQADLVVENANLATRLGDLTKDLRALAEAEKGGDGAKKNAARKRVLDTSEQVEVITREPAARCGGETKALRPTAGRLEPAKIQAVVRDHFASLRKCYEDGLARDPKLTGFVRVRFEIGRDGKVSSAVSSPTEPAPIDAVAPPGSATGAPMSDAKVVECAVGVVKSLTFPKPDGGAVTVVYPFVFAPATP